MGKTVFVVFTLERSVPQMNFALCLVCTEMNDRLPFSALLARPLDTLRRAGWLVILGLTLSLFVPGIIRYNLGTIFRDDIIRKLKPDIQAELNEFNCQKLALKNTLTQLDRRILQGADALAPTELLRLEETREKIEQRIKESKPPYHIATFYPDPLTIVWPLFYIAFLWLIFLLSPATKLGIPIFERVTIFIGVFFLYRWPTWLRNTPFLRNLGRKVYAGENFDVDPASFFLQEFQAVRRPVFIGIFPRF